MADSILVADEDGWSTITLNRPDKLNSFDEAMSRAFADALERLAEDAACRAVLLTGAGRGFCAGQDLGARNFEPGAEPPDLGKTVATFYNPVIKRIRTMRKPVICAVNGVAAGAGANIALACDIVLAAKSAKFIQSFARIGLVPDAGGTYVVPRLVGAARARGLAMLATPLGAEQAEAWGLIWKAYADEDLMNEARGLAATMATQPTQGLALTKAALDASLGNSLDDQLQLEADLQREAGLTPDYAEGVRAFLEKRTAVFTGKPQ